MHSNNKNKNKITLLCFFLISKKKYVYEHEYDVYVAYECLCVCVRVCISFPSSPQLRALLRSFFVCVYVRLQVNAARNKVESTAKAVVSGVSI